MDSNSYIISSDELLFKINQDLFDNKFKTAAKLLLETLNDWPTLNVTEPKEFLLELNIEIGSPLSFERVKKYSETLKAGNSGWKMEATSSLLRLFEYDKSKTLDRIVNDISAYYMRM